jgi:oligopeptide/dipeptide ABC transporter ATP-binding protein
MPQRHSGDGELASIPGRVPPPDNLPVGCRFHPRCPFAVEGRCDVAPIALEATTDGARVRCVRHGELDLHTAVDSESSS